MSCIKFANVMNNTTIINTFNSFMTSFFMMLPRERVNSDISNIANLKTQIAKSLILRHNIAKSCQPLKMGF